MDLYRAQPAVAPTITLDQSLDSGWVEFWYQPKIDLRRRHVAGVETFARVRHPTHGVLSPSVFMAGAGLKSLAALTELALVNALRTSANFCTLGVQLRLAVNVSLHALQKLPIPALVRRHRPNSDAWPGLIFDISEDHVVSDIPFIRELARQLEPYRISVAIDDFGRRLASLLLHRDMSGVERELANVIGALKQLKEVRFAELKLDRALVAKCGIDKRTTAVCKVVVDLAHHLRSVAVAIGIEKAADIQNLQLVGCDVGQGFLFGEPLAEQQFLSLLRDRAAKTRPAAATG